MTDGDSGGVSPGASDKDSPDQDFIEAFADSGLIDAEGAAAGDQETQDAGPNPESIGTTASRGFLWANVGVFTRYMSALLLAAVLARTLSTADYAVMVTLMVVTFYFDNALDLGMGAALVYEQETGITERVQVAFTANLGVTAVLAVLSFFVAPLITAYYHLDGYTAIFRALSVVVILSGLTTIPWSLFMRSMNFRARAGVEVSRDLTRVGVTLGLVAAGKGAWAVILGMIAAYSEWFVLTWLVVRFRPGLTRKLWICQGHSA